MSNSLYDQALTALCAVWAQPKRPLPLQKAWAWLQAQAMHPPDVLGLHQLLWQHFVLAQQLAQPRRLSKLFVYALLDKAVQVAYPKALLEQVELPELPPLPVPLSYPDLPEGQCLVLGQQPLSGHWFWTDDLALAYRYFLAGHEQVHLSLGLQSPQQNLFGESIWPFDWSGIQALVLGQGSGLQERQLGRLKQNFQQNFPPKYQALMGQLAYGLELAKPLLCQLPAPLVEDLRFAPFRQSLLKRHLSLRLEQAEDESYWLHLAHQKTASFAFQPLNAPIQAYEPQGPRWAWNEPLAELWLEGLPLWAGEGEELSVFRQAYHLPLLPKGQAILPRLRPQSTAAPTQDLAEAALFAEKTSGELVQWIPVWRYPFVRRYYPAQPWPEVQAAALCADNYWWALTAFGQSLPVVPLPPYMPEATEHPLYLLPRWLGKGKSNIAPAVLAHFRRHYRFAERQQQRQAQLEEQWEACLQWPMLEECRFQGDWLSDLQQWLATLQSKEVQKIARQWAKPNLALAKQIQQLARQFYALQRRVERLGRKTCVDGDSWAILQEYCQLTQAALEGLEQFFEDPNFDQVLPEIEEQDLYAYAYAVVRDGDYQRRFAKSWLYSPPRLPLLPDFWAWAQRGYSLLTKDLENNNKAADNSSPPVYVLEERPQELSPWVWQQGGFWLDDQHRCLAGSPQWMKIRWGRAQLWQGLQQLWREDYQRSDVQGFLADLAALPHD